MGSQKVDFYLLTYYFYRLCLFIAFREFCPEFDFGIFVLFCFYLSFCFKPLRTLMRTNMYLYPNWYLLCVFYLPYLIVCMCSVIHPCLMLCNPMDCSQQAPLSMEFSRQEYWSGLSCPPPGDLRNPGIKPRSPTLQRASLPSEPSGKTKNTGVGSLSLLQGIFPT